MGWLWMKERKAREAIPDPGLFVSAFEASPIGIAVEDLEGRPLFANPALCSMLGFSEEEMRSKHCVEFSPPEDAKKDWALFEQLRAGSIDHYQLEKRFFRRDGTVIWGRLSISLAGSGNSQLVVAMVELLGERSATKREQPQSEALLACRLIQAQEEERTRVAQKLRDHIEDLVALSIDLERLRQMGSGAETSQGIVEAQRELQHIVSDLHSLYRGLHSSTLEYLGLAAAAASLCKEIAEKQNVPTNFHSHGFPNDMPKEIALCLYRALQEALQNAIQHSGSPRLEVTLKAESNGIQLAVRDWGSGFDPAAETKGRRLGLSSLGERLRLFDGELSVESNPQLGTTVQVRVPLKRQAILPPES